MNCCKYKIHAGQTWRHKKTRQKAFIDSAYENGVYWSQDGKQHFNNIDDFVLYYEKLPMHYGKRLTFWKRILKVFKRGG